MPNVANGMVRPCFGPASKEADKGTKDEEHAMTHKLNSRIAIASSFDGTSDRVPRRT
jgi:hypothetical protein